MTITGDVGAASFESRFSMEAFAVTEFSGAGCGERLTVIAATGRIAEDWAWSGMLRQEKELRTDKLSVEKESRRCVTGDDWQRRLFGVMRTNVECTVLSLVRAWLTWN
jgi:hypothetical protein